MTAEVDDLVRRRVATTRHETSPGLDPDTLWSAGRRRRRRRGAMTGAGTVLAAALAGGITVSALGGSDSARSPAVSATPTVSPAATPSSLVTTAAPTPSPVDTAGVTGSVAAAIAGLGRTDQHLYVDPDAPARKVIDSAETLQDIGTSDIKVAALPADALGTHQTPAQLAALLGSHIGDKTAVVIVIVGQAPGAAAGRLTGFDAGAAETVMINAQSAHAGAFTEANVQGALDAAIADYVAQLAGDVATSTAIPPAAESLITASP